MAKITEAGLIIDSLAKIIERKQEKAISLMSSLIPDGETLNTDSSSVLGRIIQISAEIDYLQEEGLQELYAQLSPKSATGSNLDKIVQFKDIKRSLSSMGTASLVVYGDINVTIGHSSIVASKSTGDQFATSTSVTFKNTNSNGVEFELTNLEAEGLITINYTLTNDLSANAPISIKYNNAMTKEDLSLFVKSNIEQVSTKLKVDITSDYNVQIKPKQDGLLGDFYVTGDATIVRSFMPVTATSLYEVGIQEVDSITTIQSPTYGWRGVTNLFPSIGSKQKELDDSLRARYENAVGSLATSHMVAMYTALYAVDGVTYVSIKENTLDRDSRDGRQAHGFSVIVYGGNDMEIAEAIEKTRPLGVPMDGNVILEVNTYYNQTSVIRFSRPTQVAIKIKAGLEIYEGFPPRGVIEIKNAIIEHFNNMTFGEDVILSRLYIPMQVIDNIGIKSIEIAKVDEVFGTRNIEIQYNEIATISFDDITF